MRADGVVKRLLAGAIARKKQRCGRAARSAIIDCKLKHAVKTAQALLAPRGISREDDFGIAVAVKSATQLREFAAQLAEIVDLAVENDHETSVGGKHRLMAGGREVDDRQPLVRKSDSSLAVDPVALIVGPAMA